MKYKVISFVVIFIVLLEFNYIFKINLIFSLKNINENIKNNITNISNEFILFYRNEENKLKQQIQKTKECLKRYVNDLDHAYRCNEYRIKTPHPSRIKYPEIYDKYDGGYSAILEPSFFEGYDVIYAIPFAALLIDGRIAARNTVFKEEYIDGLKTKYLFFTGLIPETLFSYKYSDIEEEAKMFGDILVFNMINTYNNITLLMMSIHRWIIEKYPNIKYYIRCNLDALVFPWRIKGLLNKGYDVITELTILKKRNVLYPQGCFYIFSFKTVKVIYEKSFTHKPMHRADDVYYGEIIGNDTSIKKYNLKGDIIQMQWDCQFCELIKSKKMIAMHPYSPASIMIMYNISKNVV